MQTLQSSVSSNKYTYIIEGADLVLPDRILPKAVLVVQEGRIAALYPNNPPFKAAARCNDAPIIHAEGAFVLPSLVELHIHGAGQFGFECITQPAELLQVSQFLESKGIGCFVPTMLWNEESVVQLVAAIRAVDSWHADGRQGGDNHACIPGIYLEGPFVNPAKRGGIAEENILSPDPLVALHILKISEGLLKICTMAPELPGIEKIYPIVQNAGVLVSLGHSQSTLSTIHSPFHPFSITHLFNAMSGIDHKEGGLVNFAFSGTPDFIELNGDGVHVNASCLALSAKLIPEDSLILISDAVIGAGLPYGKFSYYGHTVISSKNGVRYADSGTLMGSNKLGIDIVKNFCAVTGLPLWKGVKAMSLIPRKALGIASEYGSIEIGKNADIFIWDKEMKNAVRPERFLEKG